MNKKLFFIALSILFLISFTAALDCQYIETESYSENEMVFYHNDEIIGYNLDENSLIEISISALNIDIKNNLDYDVSLYLEYYVSSTFYGKNEFRNLTVTIPGRGSERIKDPLQDIYNGDSKVVVKNLDYSYISPNIISWLIESVEKEKEFCKLCNDVTCLNDGGSCNPLYDDSKCGSGVCNIAGFCDSKKLVDCPEGKLNCQDKMCLVPSVKQVGEAYSCSFECISDRFEEGICLKSTTQVGEEKKEKIKKILIFASIIIIIISFSVYFFFRGINEKGWKKKEKQIIDKAEEKAKKIIEKSQKNLEKINNDLEDKKDQKRKLNQELISLGKKKENSKKVKKEIEKINLEINELINEKETNKKNILKKYEEEFGHEFILKNGYLKFKRGYNDPSKEGGFLHKWIFETKKGRKVKPGYQLHHKDFQKLNNNFNNLEELTPEEHRRKHNNRIK